jgi:hypothetical protein
MTREKVTPASWIAQPCNPREHGACSIPHGVQVQATAHTGKEGETHPRSPDVTAAMQQAMARHIRTLPAMRAPMAVEGQN